MICDEEWTEIVRQADRPPVVVNFTLRQAASANEETCKPRPCESVLQSSKEPSDSRELQEDEGNRSS